MQISAHLDQLRTAFPGCGALAYADLGAQMILVTSASEAIPQERWDALCENGVALLIGSHAKSARAAMTGNAEIDRAFVLEGDEIGLFLRSKTNPDDALFCVAQPSLTLRSFVDRAAAALAQIAQDD